MKQLPGLDASFLHLETPQMPMHVGALHNLELPPGYRGDFVADMRRHIAARLVLAPALRQKLVRMPLNLSNPVWVDAEPDLEAHVVGIALKPGSGQAELEAEVGRLHTVLLARDRPLWKFHVFTGLADGPGGARRYAMYTQLHHAAVDGQAAVALGQAILDLAPVGREVDQERRGDVRRERSMADMLRGALGNQLNLVMDAVKAIPGTVGVLSQMASQKVGDSAGGTVAALAARLKGQGATARATKVSNLALAPRTRLNATISDTRAFASISLPLAALNALRRRHKASLNDAVLMICSGALRRYFLQHGPLPRKSLVAGVPVSTRAAGDTASNNQATMTIVSLGTHIADPAKRLAHVLAATAAMKANLGAMKSLMPSDFPSVGLPWLMAGLGALYARAKVAERLPAIANVTISNVPGPQVPLYIAGARMLTNYPASIVVHGIGLNITVQTYDQSLEFGLMACGDAMPEVSDLAHHVQAAFDEFAALPPTVEAAAPAPAVSTKKVATKKVAAKKVPVKRAAVKKVPVQKAAVQKAAVKKAAVKKVAVKKVAVKKVAVKKVAVKKVAVKKVAVKKVAVKKAATKQAVARKPAVKKVTATRSVAAMPATSKTSKPAAERASAAPRSVPKVTTVTRASAPKKRTPAR